VEALREGDPEAACELLSKGSVKELEDRGAACCSAAMEGIFAALEGQEGSLDAVRVKEVNAAGDVATATFSGPIGEATTELTREDGEWKLSSAPGG
jgi:hypothetical protein